MMRLTLSLMLLLLVVACTPTGGSYVHISDPAGLLKPEDARKLETQLAGYAMKGIHFKASLAPGLSGKDLETVVDETLKANPVGEPGIQNGALIFIADGERKVKITCENGFEWQIPDSVSKEIYNRMVPLLAKGNYADALEQGFGEMASLLAGLDWGIRYHTVEEVYADQAKAVGKIAAISALAPRVEYPANLLETQFHPGLHTVAGTESGDSIDIVFSKYMVEQVEDGMVSPRTWYFRVTGTNPLQGNLLGVK